MNMPASFFSQTVLSAALLLSAAITDAQEYESKTKRFEGVATTGPNRILDSAARDFGVILGVPLGTISFSDVAEYNPSGGPPLALTSRTDASAVLATYVDPNYLALVGLDPGSIDPSRINVPLQKVKTLVERDGITLGTLPGIFESVPTMPSIAAPNDPITLGRWMKARGMAVIRCEGPRYASVRLDMRNLIPNRIYSAWWQIVRGAGQIIDAPLGGAPSAFASDPRGNAKFERELNFCPLDVIEGINSKTVWISIPMHSDHRAYGGVFAPVAAGFPDGTTSHIQLEFYLQGEKVYKQ